MNPFMMNKAATEIEAMRQTGALRSSLMKHVDDPRRPAQPPNGAHGDYYQTTPMTVAKANVHGADGRNSRSPMTPEPNYQHMGRLYDKGGLPSRARDYWDGDVYSGQIQLPGFRHLGKDGFPNPGPFSAMGGSVSY